MNGNYILLFLVAYPIIGAFISYLIGRYNKTIRDYFAWSVCIVMLAVSGYALVNFAALDGAAFTVSDFCALGLHFTLDGFRAVHIALTSFLWVATILFSREYFKGARNRNRYYFFTLLTFGATMGVFLSADLFTTFIFFEMMSFTSFVWVAQDETKESMRAALTYLAIAVMGGLVMLMGLFLLYNAVGTLDMNELIPACQSYGNTTVLYIVGGCLLFGFGAKAGVFLLHVWMPKSYTQSPAPASALLSGILSKTGVYGLIIVTANILYLNRNWGMFILILGTLTMVGGAVMALCSCNLKRTLACSSMSQIGFIVVGIGMIGILGVDNGIAARGTVLHMINHSLIKLILFMAAGVIFMNIKKLDLNEIRGFGRNKTVLKIVFLIAGLGIGGVPLFNGYISKTLIHEAISEGYAFATVNGSLLQAVEDLFIISGGFTIAYMAKLFICIFVEKNTDQEVQQSYDEMGKTYISRMTSAILMVTALALPVLGTLPYVVTDRLGNLASQFNSIQKVTEAEQASYFGFEALKSGCISILIGVVLYVGIVRIILMKRDENAQLVYFEGWPKWWNVEDYIYRPVLLKILPFIGGVASRVVDSVVDGTVVFLRNTLFKDKKDIYELEEGTRLTYLTGTFCDTVAGILNKTFRRKRPIEQNFIHRLAMGHDMLVENNHVITRSLSFGLMLFCVGFIMTLAYLLIL